MITNNNRRKCSKCGDFIESPNWSSKEFYKTMCFVFRSKLDRSKCIKCSQSVDPPFFLNRPLEEKDFINAQQMYVMEQMHAHIEKLMKTSSKLQTEFPDPERWPECIKDMEIMRAFGELYTAQSKPKQEKARVKVRNLAMRGPSKYRTLLRVARAKTPQAKNLLDGIDILHLVKYRAKRQFLWQFLRKEAEAESGRLERSDAASHLTDKYKYLGLTEEQIEKGLKNPNQKDDDVAEEFHISGKTAHSLLTKFYKSVN